MSLLARTSLLPRFVDALLPWRRVCMALAILTTVAVWPLSRKLSFEQSIESLYADEDPHLRQFLTSRGMFGGDEFVLVVYPESDLFEPNSNALTERAARRIDEFGQQLSAVPGIAAESTQHLAKALRFPYGRATVRQIVVGVLVGQDARTTAIVLRLLPEKESPVSRAETIARIRDIAASHDPPAMVVGEPIQIHDMFRYVEQDGQTLFFVSLALLALVLLLLLQRLRWVVLPVLVVVVSIVWTEATLVVSGLRLSMVSSMLNSLMTIVGVATVTHMSLYFREQRRTLEPLAALRQTLIDQAFPVWWSIATTALGFGVLVSSQINPVRSFGGMMALGSFMVLVAAIVLVPGCILVGRTVPEPHPSAADRRVSAVLGRITLWVEHHPRRVSLASLALVLFAALGFTRLRVETDFSKNFRKHSPIVRALQFVESQLGGAGSWEVNFPAPANLTDEYIERVRNFAQRLRAEFGDESQETSRTGAGRLSKVLAITDGLDLIPERILFKSLSLETRLGLLASIQRDFVSSLYNPTAGRMRILLRAYERQPSESKLKLIADVERLAREIFGDAGPTSSFDARVGGESAAFADDRGSRDSEADAVALDSAQSPKATRRTTAVNETVSHPPARSTGLFVLLAFLIENLMDDQWTSFFLAGLGITAMMWIAFRSLPVGLISLVPNVFPIVLVIGLMGWFDLPINIATAMIASVSMGLTVDSSIHYLAAYRRAQRGGMSVFEALHHTHRHVGRSLVYSNVALMAGFSVLALSHFVPLIYFGLLVSLAMLGGLIGNLVFLPLLIGWWEGRRELL